MCPTITGSGMRRKSKRWQRLSTVGGSFCGSVVASTKMVCAGGSSSVFSSALNADFAHHVHFVDDVELAAQLRRARS